MNLWRLIERNLAQRRLSSTLTAISVALGVMLVCAILVVQREMESTYQRQGEGFSLVVGPATGAPLTIVLNSIYHVDQSPGLMPFSIYRELAGPTWKKRIRLAVPYAVGDSFRGYRVVATTDDVFSPVFPYPRAATTEDKFAAGRPFRFAAADLDEALADLAHMASDHGDGDHAHDHAHDHRDDVAEAVLGHEVAAALGIGVGAEIEPTHGVEGDAKAHEHEQTWKVVGVLKRSGTPLDRVVLVNMDSFYRISDHAGALIPGSGEAALSAVLVFPGPGVHKALVLTTLKKRTDIQVAEVATEIRKLLDIVGHVDRLFFFVALLTVVIGVLSIMVAIYNTMNERRRELAIMRAIGARRATIFASIVGESTALACTGAILGVAFGHALIWAAAGAIEEASGLRLDPLRVHGREFVVVAIVTLAGAFAGMIPAWKAYRTDVARNLAPLS